MKFLLIAILINATSGDPVAIHVDAPFDTPQLCGEAAQAKGIVLVHDNIATEYVCRQTDENGVLAPEVKVGPDGSPLDKWLQKQIERQTESNS